MDPAKESLADARTSNNHTFQAYLPSSFFPSFRILSQYQSLQNNYRPTISNLSPKHPGKHHGLRPMHVEETHSPTYIHSSHGFILIHARTIAWSLRIPISVNHPKKSAQVRSSALVFFTPKKTNDVFC